MSNDHAQEIVITGLGVVSPIGIGANAFWDSLVEGRSGIARVEAFDPAGLPVQIAGEVRDFDPKAYVQPRKSLKLMERDAQLSVAAARMACNDAQLEPGAGDPDRFGVVFGADRIRNHLRDSTPVYRACVPNGKFDYSLWASHGMPAMFPLGFLRVLPNMLASHISIVWDARGPNNTIHQNEVSALVAMIEAARVIERGMADIMITGGACARMHPLDWVRFTLTRELARDVTQPAAASRPFDQQRQGAVMGEGAAAFVLEKRRHAEARGARILGTLRGGASACEPVPKNAKPTGTAVRHAVERAARDADLDLADLGHVNAHGTATRHDDAIEAQALAELLNDTPVTALKSYFGDLSAGGGAVELGGSLLALSHGLVPATLNYEHPDRDCPINVVSGAPLEGTAPSGVVLNHTPVGQAAAVIVTRD